MVIAKSLIPQGLGFELRERFVLHSTKTAGENRTAWRSLSDAIFWSIPGSTFCFIADCVYFSIEFCFLVLYSFYGVFFWLCFWMLFSFVLYCFLLLFLYFVFGLFRFYFLFRILLYECSAQTYSLFLRWRRCVLNDYPETWLARAMAPIAFRKQKVKKEQKI